MGPDIPDPEEIGACGAMDFYQQNIWHKVTLNMNNLLLSSYHWCEARMTPLKFV